MTALPTPDVGLRTLTSTLAWTLRVGSWVGAGLLAVAILAGGGAPHPGPFAARLSTAGLGLLVALPVARVAIMAVYFLRRRELDFACIAGFVVLIIALSVVLGLRPA